MANTFKDRVSPTSLRYQLDEDSLRGFRTAVKNSTPILALEYASLVIKDLLERVTNVESELEALKAQSTPPKTAAKRSTATSEEGGTSVSTD